MLDNAEPQGFNLGSTQQPSAAVAPAPIAPRKPVSADSFRRLSALLKKPAPLAPVPVPTQAPVQNLQVAEVVAPIVAVAEVAAVVVPSVLEPEPEILLSMPEPEFVPMLEISPISEIAPIAPVIDTNISSQVEAADNAEISAEFSTQPFPEVAPSSLFEELPISGPVLAAEPPAVNDPDPVMASVFDALPSEPLIIQPVVNEDLATEVAAVDLSALLPSIPVSVESAPPSIISVEPKFDFPIAEDHSEIVPTLALPEIIEQVEEIAVLSELPTQPEASPSKVETTVQREKPRDAFALPPSASLQTKPKPAPVAIQQTPEQEQASAELARSLLDMMASGASSGLPQERALAADTLLRMLPRLPLKSMVMLAERLCMMEAPPHLLVTKLICDPRIEVAGPLLEECSHITDEDLSLVIQEGEPAKRRMMARRRHVSRTITGQLVNTADSSVLLNLVRNQHAEISHESFVQLVQIAETQEELLAPLCIRADLPVPFAFELFWHAPAQLRRYLLSRFLTDSETLTKILKIARDTNGDEASNPEFSNADKIMEALQLADDGQLDEAASILGAAAQINPATALRIMSDRQGEPLAALFKAVGITRSASNEILYGLKNSISGLIDPARDPDELQGLFDSLSFNKARILLTYWDWATLKTGPYAPLN